MRKSCAVLEKILNCHEITNDTNYEFLYHLQYALLLALREQGILTPMQHRQAEEKLNQQRRDRARRKQEEL